jgi:hypothetical protein
VLFEALDGTSARLAGTMRQRTSNLLAGLSPRGASPRDASPSGGASRFAAPGLAADGRTAAALTTAGREHVARLALPAYGRLAQSVGGAVAFGQMMAALPQDVGETLARAPLAPADLGRLLIDVGVHPDDMNAVLVGEMLSQSVPVQEKGVRVLRRELAAAGGSTRDAAPAVALSRLGLPITPLSLAVARQLLAGQLDPSAAWGELLPDLQHLARFAGNGSQAGALAAELLADWEVPFHDSPEAVSRWLRAAIDQVATPLEAKLARLLASSPRNELAPTQSEPATTLAQNLRAGLDRPEPEGRAPLDQPGQEARTRLDLAGHDVRAHLDRLGQDVRARLDAIDKALPPALRQEHDSLGQALQRTQATVQAEQILNGAKTEQTEPRFFAVTLPTVMNQQPSTLHIRVRERDARPRSHGEAARPDVLQLKLSLPGLGDLGVNLTIGQQSVACHFAAGSAFAEALLSAGAGQLIGRLQRLGYPQTSVEAAHEPPEIVAPGLAAVPRVSRVDLSA